MSEQLSGSVSPDFQEVTVSELVELIKAVPVPDAEGGEGWKQVMDYQVLPLSLDEYWNAFYADNCPYQVQGMFHDEESILIQNTEWGPPTPEFATVGGV